MARNTRKGAILPRLDSLNCSKCMLCENVCPILNIQGPRDQFKALSTGIFYATDAEIFAYSSSGGATGAILKYLFDNNVVDCAVVTGVSGKHAQPKLIRSADDISRIQGSKYQPVALNEILGEIPVGERFAFVGLPCHIDGLRRLSKHNKKIRNGLTLAIGIYCTIGRGMLGTDAALNGSAGMTGDLCYRYGEYPGKMGFLDNKKFGILAPFVSFLEQFDYLFYPKGCHYCDDLYNAQADISIGDSWGLGCGKSAIVMARTGIGEETINNAEMNGMLCKVRSASNEENYATQQHSYDYKIINYYSRMKSLAPFTNKVIKGLLPVSRNRERYLPHYLLLYFFGALLNNRFGYRVATSDLCRKFLLKIRNKLLRSVI